MESISYKVLILAGILFGLLFISSTVIAGKPALILLPVQGQNINRIDQEHYRIALQKSLSRYFKVYSGGEVEKRLEKSSAITCDVNECLQEVAISFQGELIGRMVLTSMDGGFLVAIEIKNIFDDQTIASNNIACEGCNNFDVIRELNKMTLSFEQDNTSASVAIESPVVDENIVEPIEVKKSDLSAREKIIWESIDNGDSAEMYQLYLDQYPNGVYVEIAKLKILGYGKTSVSVSDLESSISPEESATNLIGPISGAYTDNFGNKISLVQSGGEITGLLGADGLIKGSRKGDAINLIFTNGVGGRILYGQNKGKAVLNITDNSSILVGFINGNKDKVWKLTNINREGKNKGTDDITGVYVDNYDKVVELNQIGNKIIGDTPFRYGNSEINGTYVNGIIKIELQPENGSKGKGELRIFDAGNVLKGTIKMLGYTGQNKKWVLTKE